MRSACLVIVPNRPTVTFEDTEERYGLTKESGLSFAMISYALPGAFPRELPSMRELEASTLRYGSASELAEIMTRVTLDEGYRRELLSRAERASLAFTPTAIGEREIGKLLGTRIRRE
jgi:hypothetical protein